jgi:putative redox protein
MTLKAYADRKGWPLEAVEVTVSGAHKEGAFVLTRTIRVKGNLSGEQHAHLLEIAEKCPVHKSLTGPIHIESTISPLTPG